MWFTSYGSTVTVSYFRTFLEKEINNRLLIVVSNGDVEKILAIFVLENGTAEIQSSIILDTLRDRNINTLLKALSSIQQQ